jgi:hypothetical protein
LSGLYELPFGKGKRFGSGVSGKMNNVIGGWQINTITTLQSGLPFTPTLAVNGLNNGNWQLPDRIGDGSLPTDQRTPTRWFNTSIDPADPNRGFSVPAPFQFGNSGYEILRGPGFATVDFAVHKNIQVTERTRLQFRLEAFNILNRANFSLPAFNLGVASAGTIASTVTTNRQVQVVGKFEF